MSGHRTGARAMRREAAMMEDRGNSKKNGSRPSCIRSLDLTSVIGRLRSVATGSSRPLADFGKNRKQPFAAWAERQKVAVRYSQTIFASGTSGSECIAATGPGRMYFSTRPQTAIGHSSPKRPLIRCGHPETVSEKRMLNYTN